jgi:hypothetical protein
MKTWIAVGVGYGVMLYGFITAVIEWIPYGAFLVLTMNTVQLLALIRNTIPWDESTITENI